MSLTLINPPPSEPVTLAEFKEHLKIDTAAEDAFLSGLLVAARQAIESRWRIAVMAQGWRLALDEAPDCAILLPLSPVLSVDSVGIVRGGVVESLPAASLEAETGPVGRVLIKGPAASEKRLGGVVIAFTAGWPDAASVPSELKLAIRLLAAHHYEHREGEAPPPSLAAYAAPYRRVLL